MGMSSPSQATAESLKAIVHLARAPHLFLSAYLSTSPSDTTTEGVRLRLQARLNEVSRSVADTPWEEPFHEERRMVEAYIRSLRPGGPGLALLRSQVAQEWHALWLPDPVTEHVRFGRGAYVLPLLDLLDEWEPVCLARVAKDKAWIMVVAAGRVEEILHMEADVPGRHKAGGGAAPRYQSPIPALDAGGGAAARYQRHILVHVADHLKRVAQEVESAHRRHSFRRLFLAGPSQALAMFRSHLPQEMSNRVVGHLAINPHASGASIQQQVLLEAGNVERREELALVQKVITQAEKGQGAVIGLASTLNAMNRREVHHLVIAGEMNQPGRYCLACDLLFPPENVACPQCNQRTLVVDLWEELPSFALSRSYGLEVVHGEAASLLWHYDGLGALLRLTPH